MSNVTLSKNGDYWQARWTDRRGRQQSKGLGKRTEAGGTVSRRAAMVRIRRIQSDLDAGKVADGPSPTLRQLFDRFRKNELAGKAKNTVQGYELTMLYLLEAFDERKKPTEQTVCRHVREAKAIFRMAVDDELLARNPFRRLSGNPPTPDKNWRYVTRPELTRLLEACPHDGWRCLLALCRLAGLRRGEALRLEWADVDLDRRRLNIVNPGQVKTTKKRSRQVPIDPDLHTILFAVWMKGEQERPCAMRCRSFHRDFQVIRRRAGLEKWARWCHTLRKNAETDWGRKYPIHTVTEWLGNSPKVAMDHYLHAVDAEFDAAAGIVNAAARDEGRSKQVPKPA